MNGEHSKPVESRTEDLVAALREARKTLEGVDATSFDGPPAASLYLRAANEIERLRAIEQAAGVFYKRVSFRVPGLLAQVEDVAKPLTVALGFEEAT